MHSYAIISDVHANLEALQAVLEKIENDNIDKILFLGDSVGYGPDPNDCTDILKQKAAVIVAGNHDRAATGQTDTVYFNPYAKAAIEWTNRVLTDQVVKHIQSLPITERLIEDNIFLVHATPQEPEKWHYLSYKHNASENFKYFEESICFLGHSHIPFIVELSHGGELGVHYTQVAVREGNRYIVNVGSIGQPRDGNPDATYVLLKNKMIIIKRVSYDILLTQNKMRRAGLPSYLVERLSRGR